MKNLFVLMALAGLAAFQIGCGGDSATPAKPTGTGPAMSTPGAGAATGMPAAAADAKKEDEKPKEDAAPTGDEKTDEAASTEEKKDE